MPADAGRPVVIYLPPWRIDITLARGVVSPAPRIGLAHAVAGALVAAGAPAPASVSVILAGDSELADLNRRHMHRAGPTDVLSFPLLAATEFPPHADGPTAPGPTQASGEGAPIEVARFTLPAGVRVHLGDIVVSVERARAQAIEGRGGQTGDVRWSPADELLLLVTHGTLHLCGWDHAEPLEEAAMRDLERQLLDGGKRRR